jgi:diguanylate cyclase (GGDEF)-like protein
VARVRFWYAVVMLLLVSGYFLLPSVRTIFDPAIGVVAVAAIEYGIRELRPQRRGAWRCLQVALVLLMIGDTIFDVLDARSPEPVPFPAVPDAFYLAAYLPLTVGLFWLGRPTLPYRDETSLIDAVSVTLAGSLIVWIALVRPGIDAQHLQFQARLVAVASWVGYIAVFSASVRVMLAWRRNMAVMLLGIAVVAFLVADIFYGRALIHGNVGINGPVDLGYFFFTTFAGAAALTPSMRHLATSAHARHNLSPWRLTLIAAGLLVAPTALLVESTHGPVTTGVAIAIVSALVSILMLIRLTMTGRAYQRRAAREHAARVASQAMVAATTRDEVVQGTRRALRSVLPSRGVVGVELVRPYRQPPVPVPSGPGPPSNIGQLTVPLIGSDAALTFTAPAHELAELAELLASLADQAALALQRIDLIEEARAEERERYFRTLVLTSTDVTLISRDGRIEYATPSAQAMFGRDIVGQRLEDVVRPTPEAEAKPAPGALAPSPQWSDVVEGAEGMIDRGDGPATVLLHRRDLTDDPTVRGVVTTLRDITEERALKRDLAYRASHDELTGLANARAWGETMTSEGERRGEPGDGMGVIFIDLDNFKQINDTYGHPVGDLVLADVARRIASVLRAEDLAARVGGDEFAVLLRGLTDVEDARGVAERLAETLARPALVDSISVECKASIGLSYTEGKERVRALVLQADTALYAAKEQGKGRWTQYNPVQWAPPRKQVAGAAGARDAPAEA